MLTEARRNIAAHSLLNEYFFLCRDHYFRELLLLGLMLQRRLFHCGGWKMTLHFCMGLAWMSFFNNRY